MIHLTGRSEQVRLLYCRRAIREDWPRLYGMQDGAHPVAEAAAWVWGDGAAWDRFSMVEQAEWVASASEAIRLETKP